MARQLPWDDVPESTGKDTFPEGDIKFKIEDLVETLSKNSGKAMLVMTLRASAPAKVKGYVFTKYLVLGSDEDKLADDPKTVSGSSGMKFLRRVLKKANVPLVPDLDKQAKKAEGAEFIASVDAQVSTEEGKFKGNIDNNITKVFAVGEREPRIYGDDVRQATAAAAAIPATADTDDDEV